MEGGFVSKASAREAVLTPFACFRDGVFGLWLDSELYHGHSEPSRSFENEALCSKRDFLVVGVELWALGS